jgi:hypothetical protein
MLLIVACERQTTWEMQKTEIFPVVDCIITNEYKYQELNIYSSVSNLNEPPSPVSAAKVVLFDSRDTIQFVEDIAEPGKYF